MWDRYHSLDLIITTKTKQNWITSRGCFFFFLGAQLSYKTFSSSSENQENNNNNNNIFIYSGEDTRLGEKIVWVRWSLKVFLSVAFHFPFSVNKWKLISTCQNCEISISIEYCNCSAGLVSWSLNKFVGKAKVLDISNLSEI